MTQGKDISQELNELQSSLAQKSLENGYAVPAGYFDGLADRLLAMVRALDVNVVDEELRELSPLLASISRKNVYSVPSNYFAELDAGFVFYADDDAKEEIGELSALLGGLKKEMPFSTPAGYFESLELINPAVKESKPAKLITMNNRKWLRYAAAAIMVGFISMSAIFYFNRSKDASSKDPAEWVAKNVKEESINKFIESTSEDPSDATLATASEDVKALMKDISDKDIQEFLNDTRLGESDNEDDFIMN